jgi:hypothetical protein
MAIIYDHAITEARRAIALHERSRRSHGIRCTAGCGRWPCQPYLKALAVITRNSTTPASRFAS